MQIAFDYAAYQLGVPLGVHWTPGPASPVHWLVVGPSGTGKTIFSSTLAARMVIHGNAKLWIGSYKDDDFFQFCRREQQPVRYYAFNDAITAVEEFHHILEARLAGDRDRSLCLLWIDELAAMITGLEKKKSEFVKNAVATILQTGRSLNCQILVSVQRADSVYFNNGAKENFGNICFLGPHISKEAAGMFSVDREALPPIKGRAGYYIVNGNTEAIRAIQVPVIHDTRKIEKALLKGLL